MNINIAFSTIIYIMVFLFPGILFRRAVFSGDFLRHFDSGNPFERLLWNMLCSILCIAGCYVFVHYYNIFLPVKIVFDLQTSDVFDTFICIYENKLPTIFVSEDRIRHAMNLLFFLYLFSFLIGLLINRFLLIFGLQKAYSFFQLQNSWQNLTNSSKRNNISHTTGHIYYTKVDIKTATNELFTGKLHRICLDKEGNMEAISIQEAYKFYRLSFDTEQSKIDDIKALIADNDPHIIEHISTSNSFIYRKRIKGDIFTIIKDEIQNVSITYIKISNVYRNFQKVLKITASVLLTLLLIFSLGYLFWDFKIFNFENYFQRLVLCITTPLFSAISIVLIASIFDFSRFSEDYKYYLREVKDNLLILIFIGIPYLYSFQILSGYITMFALLVQAVICASFMTKKPT